jgi:ribose transport system substrate-binding protein
MKKLTRVLFGALFLTLLILNSCSRTRTSENERLLIGVVVKTLSSEYWKYVQAGAVAAGKDLNVDVQVLGPNAETAIAEQIAMIEDSISKGVNAICVAPNQSDTVVPILQRAVQNGIPVLFIDTDADMAEKTTFLGTGHEVAARQGADYIGKILGSGKKAVIIGAAMGNATGEARIRGYTAGLTAAGIEVLDVQAADADADKAMNVMENFLQRYNQIDVVMCANDAMAIGAMRAIEQSGRNGIKVLGYDGISVALDAILAGEMECTIAQQPYNIGYMGVEAAVRAAKGETVEKRIDTGAALITKDNVQEYKEKLLELLKNIE